MIYADLALLYLYLRDPKIEVIGQVIDGELRHIVLFDPRNDWYPHVTLRPVLHRAVEVILPRRTEHTMQNMIWRHKNGLRYRRQVKV